MATKYNKEDLIPIVYCVLGFILIDVIEGAFKFSIEKYYPDLKGLLDHDTIEVDDETLDLLYEQPDDEIISCVFKYITDLEKVMETFRNVHALDVRMIDNDERIGDLAEDIYNTTGGSLSDESSFVRSLTDLLFFTYSTPVCLHYLCKLVVFEELDLKTEFNDDIYNSFYEDSFTIRPDHVDVNEVILFELMQRIFEYNEELVYLIWSEPGYATKKT